MILLRFLITACLITVFSGFALAQGTQVAFGTIQDNSGLPVEITADALAVDQASGEAVFTGNVVIVQGEMRLSAQRVLVEYRDEPQGISRVEATGDVILISGADAAESEQAEYNVDDGPIVMTGNVLLAQGLSALTADKLTVQVESGTAQMSGRVKTVIQPEEN